MRKNITIADQSVKGLFHDELSVQDNEFGTDWDQVIAPVVFEELHEHHVISIFPCPSR